MCIAERCALAIFRHFPSAVFFLNLGILERFFWKKVESFLANLDWERSDFFELGFFCLSFAALFVVVVLAICWQRLRISLPSVLWSSLFIPVICLMFLGSLFSH